MQCFKGTYTFLYKDNFITKFKELIFDNPFQLTLNSIDITKHAGSNLQGALIDTSIGSTRQSIYKKLHIYKIFDKTNSHPV
jgi:hypothetical protein